MTDALIEFLRARLAEDQAAAHEAAGEDRHSQPRPGTWTYTETTGGDHKVVNDLGDSVMGHYDIHSSPWNTGPHIARHDPQRVLAEVEFKRAVIRLAELQTRDAGWQTAVEQALRHMAVSYAWHPGYRSEWCAHT